MNGTLHALGLLNSPAGLALGFLFGILLGFFLEQAGFGSSRRLAGVFYLRDLSLVKMMFTAVVVCMLGSQYLVAFGCLRPSEMAALKTFWPAQIVGGLLFGVGLAMGGWCPGTALVGMASGKADALVFVLGALAGALTFNEVFVWLRPFYQHGSGVLTLPVALGWSAPLVVLLFCVLAVALFMVCTWAEKRVTRREPSRTAVRWNRLLALVALAGAGFAFLLPPPRPPAPVVAQVKPRAEVVFSTHLLAEIAKGQDRIEPLALADQLMNGAKPPFLVDLRSATDFAKYHLPGAVHIALRDLPAKAAAVLPADRPVVLYANGTVPAAQAWLELRHLGWHNIRLLSGGLLAFWRDCLTPPSLQGVPYASLQAQAEHRAFLLRRRAFLEPHAVATAAAAGAGTGKPVLALQPPGLEGHLVSTKWVAQNLGEPNVVILDVRPDSTAFTTSHIPEAVYIGIGSFRSPSHGIPGMLAPPSSLADLLGRSGIDADTSVVVYSDALRDATLAALALASLGQRSFAVMQGGFHAWTSEHRPVTARIDQPTPRVYQPAPQESSFIVETEAVRLALDRGRAVMLDVRPADYYSGAKSEEARAGHIPGALNREYTLDLVPGEQTWQELDHLRAAYKRLGVDGSRPVIVYSRTGHSASQTFFLLHYLLGMPHVRWYDGSWSAWAADSSLPVSQ